MSKSIWKLSTDANSKGTCFHQNGQNWNIGRNIDTFIINNIDANNNNQNLWIKNLVKLLQISSIVFLTIESNLGSSPNMATYFVKGVNIGENNTVITVKYKDYTGSVTIGGNNAQLTFNYYT